MRLTKSLGSLNLFGDNDTNEEDISCDLDLNSAIEKQKAEKYKPLKTFLSICLIYL